MNLKYVSSVSLQDKFADIYSKLWNPNFSLSELKRLLNFHLNLPMRIKSLPKQGKIWILEIELNSGSRVVPAESDPESGSACNFLRILKWPKTFLLGTT